MPNHGTSSHSSQSPTQKRKSTGKRLRFETFKRDGFTCQYCGAQPPSVVLVVDHITPVSGGGNDDPLNLITACEPCNQGKADKPLGDRIARPDADLLYLETQQETAEIERYLAALKVRESRIEEVTEALVQHWFVFDTKASYAPSWLPPVVRNLLTIHDARLVESAIAIVAGKVATGYLERGHPTDRYLHGVVRNLAAQEEGDD